MNLVYNILFSLTAIPIAVFDFKYQKIPLWLILLNYLLLSLLVNPIFLIGLIIILILKKFDKPIDIVYLFIISYLIIIIGSIWSVLSIIVMLIFILISKKDKLSYMVPIELVCIIELILKEVL